MANLKAIGYDSTQGRIQAQNSSDLVKFKGDVTVEGDFIVEGAQRFVSSETVLFDDSILLLGRNYFNTATQESGFASVIKVEDKTEFLSYDSANQQITVAGNAAQSTFAALDLICFGGDVDSALHGVYEVEAVAASGSDTVITLEAAADVDNSVKSIAAGAPSESIAANASKTFELAKAHVGIWILQDNAKPKYAQTAVAVPAGITFDVMAVAADVATNAGNISTNQGNITSNSTSISNNASSITSIQTSLTTNATNITTNATAISSNASALTTANTNIGNNTSSISTNAGNITTNATGVSNNTSSITTATTNITTNTGNISTNTSSISTNASSISTNNTNVAALNTSLGTSAGDTHLGNFSGNILSDSITAKAAIQEVADAIESGSSSTVTTTSGQIVNSAFLVEEAVAIGSILAVGNEDNTLALANASSPSLDSVIGVAIAASSPTQLLTSTFQGQFAAVASELNLGFMNNLNQIASDKNLTFTTDADGNGGTQVFTITFKANNDGSGDSTAFDASQNAQIGVGLTASPRTLDAIVTAVKDLFGQAPFASHTTSNIQNNVEGNDKVFTVTAPVNNPGNTPALNFDFTASDATSDANISAAHSVGSDAGGASAQFHVHSHKDSSDFLNGKHLRFAVAANGSDKKYYKITFDSSQNLAANTGAWGSESGADQANAKTGTIFYGDATDVASQVSIADKLKALLDAEFTGGAGWTTTAVDPSGDPSQNDAIKLQQTTNTANNNHDFDPAETFPVQENSSVSVAMPGSIVSIPSAIGAVTLGQEIWLSDSTAGSVSTTPASSGTVWKLGYITTATASNSAYKMVFLPQINISL